jgi:hypothetical protein
VARVGGGSEGSSRVTSCVVKTKVVSSEINKSRWEAADGRPMDAYGRLWTPMDADGRRWTHIGGASCPKAETRLRCSCFLSEPPARHPLCPNPKEGAKPGSRSTASRISLIRAYITSSVFLRDLGRSLAWHIAFFRRSHLPPPPAAYPRRRPSPPTAFAFPRAIIFGRILFLPE